MEAGARRVSVCGGLAGLIHPPGFVYAQIDAVRRAEQDKGPAGAVREADDYEGDEYGQARFEKEPAPPRQTPNRRNSGQRQRQWLENISEDKALKRHVPASPVISNASGP